MFSIFRSRGAAFDIAALPPPWPAGSVSLRECIAQAAMRGENDDDPITLEPVEPLDPEAIRYADGLSDALFGGGDTPTGANARALVAALGRLVRRPDAAAYRHLHDQLAGSDVMGVIDGFLPRVPEQGLPPERVAAIARHVAAQSPDVAAVKLAIGLLGVCSEAQSDIELVLELGRYDELTLYCAVALTHMTQEAERPLWVLARRAAGWGRIQAIRRLTHIRDPDIRAWLLRDGFRNDIMVEEIAYHCAVEGDLLKALRDGPVDTALLQGAGQIIEA